MLKRVLSIIVVVAMMLSTIVMCVSCNSTDATSDEVTADVEQSIQKAVTLTLYTIKGDNTSQETIEQIQDEINKITEAKLNCHIVLRAYTANEYYNVIDEKINAIDAKQKYDEQSTAASKFANKAVKSVGATTTPVETEAETETDVETDETVVNELGLKETVYPEVSDDQIDIFLVTNIEKYYEYHKRGVLLQLDEVISSNGKILSDIIFPKFLQGVKIEGGTYGVPNNHVVGEYEYMVINKRLFDSIYMNKDNVATFDDLQEYVEYCSKQSGITPIVDTYGVDTFLYYPLGAEYPFAGYVEGKVSDADKATVRSLLDIRAYRKSLTTLYSWRQNNYISTNTSIYENGNFGVAFVKGDYNDKALLEASGNYYVVPYKYPTYSNEEVFSSVYCVGSFTSNLTRAMDVIALFTTNEKFINTMAYGVEGVHYSVDEYTGEVTLLNNDYDMNPLYAGNQFKLWQYTGMTEKEKAMSDNNWAAGKLQNADAQVSPYLGFCFDTDPEIDYDEIEQLGINLDDYEDSAVLLEEAKQLTDEIYTKINSFVANKTYSYTYVDDAGETVTESKQISTFEEYLEFLSYEYATKRCIKQLTDISYPYSIAGEYDAMISANIVSR